MFTYKEKITLLLQSKETGGHEVTEPCITMAVSFEGHNAQRPIWFKGIINLFQPSIKEPIKE